MLLQYRVDAAIIGMKKKFMVLSRLNCIYNGMHALYMLTGEFGVVYRGKLGFKGMSYREVAIKTLKGLFNMQ